MLTTEPNIYVLLKKYENLLHYKKFSCFPYLNHLQSNCYNNNQNININLTNDYIKVNQWTHISIFTGYLIIHFKSKFQDDKKSQELLTSMIENIRLLLYKHEAEKM